MSIPLIGGNAVIVKTPKAQHLDELLAGGREQGANAISFNRISKCYAVGTDIAPPPADWGTPSWRDLLGSDIGQDPTHPYEDTVSVDRLHWLARRAAEEGYEQIMIKVLVDSDFAQWRGFLTLPHTRYFAFLSAYKTYVLEPLLPILKDPKLRDKVVLCFGTEMVTITQQYGAEPWLALAKWLRGQGVRCRLCYAANWGWWNPLDQSEMRDIEALYRAVYTTTRYVAPYVDLIGLDIYLPLVGERYTGPLTYEAFMAGTGNVGYNRVLEDNDGNPMTWMVPFGRDVDIMATEFGKKVCVTEIGFARQWYAAVEPAREPPDPLWVPEYTVARECVRYARDFWYHKPYVESVYWWEIGLPSEPLYRAGVGHRTHNIYGNELGRLALGLEGYTP